MLYMLANHHFKFRNFENTNNRNHVWVYGSLKTYFFFQLRKININLKYNRNSITKTN